MEKIICIGSLKGGVGKTTTAVNLSAALARFGKNTLLVDCDQQGSATLALGFNKKRIKRSLGNALLGNAGAADLVLDCKLDYLKIIPSNSRHFPFDFNSISRSGKEMILRDVLSEIESAFDHIVIDTPPSQDFLTINALSASHSLLIPLQCDFMAYESLVPYLRFVRWIRERFNPELKLSGILLTMYREGQNISQQIALNIRKNLKSLVFNTVIPQSVLFSEASSAGKPIVVHDSKSMGGLSYLNLAKELLARRSNPKYERRNKNGRHLI
ncbi:MAG: ParA family protein [Deltaproteobacteria bacterium]|nr:ParA family protein [Deltaproteobacteria bacterium]